MCGKWSDEVTAWERDHSVGSRGSRPVKIRPQCPSRVAEYSAPFPAESQSLTVITSVTYPKKIKRAAQNCRVRCLGEAVGTVRSRRGGWHEPPLVVKYGASVDLTHG